MKFNFYNRNVVCCDYRRGTIQAFIEEKDFDNIKEEYKQEMIEKYSDKYLVGFYYQEENNGIISHMVGYWIDSDDDVSIQEEIKKNIMSGYFDESINIIEKQAEEMEEWFCERMEKEMANNKK